MAGYIGNSPTPVPLTSADLADSIITSAKIADGTIASADLASNAVDTQALSLFNASGSAPVYACRAWVNWDGYGGSGTNIRGSGNVSSITYNGTGDYTINFATAMPDANYVATTIGQQVSGVGNNGTVGIYPDGAVPTASALRIISGVGNGTNDFTFVNVAIFR